MNEKTNAAVELTTQNFDTQILESAKPTLVDFWGERHPPLHCQYCLAVEPMMEELATKWQGDLSVGRVDVDKNRALAARFEVVHLPTFVLFIDGKEAARVEGVGPDRSEKLVEVLQKHAGIS